MKIKLEIILSVLILIIFLIGGFTIWYLKNEIHNLQSYQSVYLTGQQPNKIWQAKDSSWHNNVQDAEVSSSEMKTLQELQNIHSEFTGVHKSLNNLENYQQVATVTTIHKVIHVHDTIIYRADSSKIKGQTFSYHDKFEDIKEVITKDSSWIDIKHEDSLDIAQYWDRKWLLAKKHYDTEIRSANPNTRIKYQRNIKAKRKKGLFKNL